MYLSANWKSLALEVAFWTSAGMLIPVLFRREPVGIAITLSLMLLLFFARRKWGRPDQAKPLTPNEAQTSKSHPHPLLLVIGSRRDEAWQVLHHMRNANNPLAVKSNLFTYLLSAFRSYFAQRTAANRLYYGDFWDVGSGAILLGAIAAWCVLGFLLSAIVWLIIERPEPEAYWNWMPVFSLALGGVWLSSV
jgi:hypothetical protein